MPNKIVKTLLLDSSKSAILHVYMESDGNEGDLSNFVLLDPKTDFYNSDAGLRIQMTLKQVWYSFSWFDGLLTFDDLVPYPSWQLTRDAIGYHDFRYFGGIKDRSSIDTTGKVLISTNGFAALGNVGTMVIEVGKNIQSPTTTNNFALPV